MSTPSNQGPPSLSNAVALLLGRQASAGGPFALLGLTPDDCTQDLVIVQLQRQLARIAAHPMGTTQPADAVRAALHAAAAELLEGLDAESPGDMSAHVPTLTPTRSGCASSPLSDGSPPVSPPASPQVHMPRAQPARMAVSQTRITPELATSAREMLAEHGGWNAKSRQRLTFLAYSAGVGVQELLAAAQDVVQSSPAFETPAPAMPGPPQRATPRVVGVSPDAGLYVNEDGTPRNTPFAEEIDPGRRLVKWLFIAIGGGFATLIVIAVVAYIALKSPRTPSASPSPSLAQGTLPAKSGTSPSSSELFPSPKGAVNEGQSKAANSEIKPTAPVIPRDFGDDLRDLARSVSMAGNDPAEALQLFDSSIKAIASGWSAAQPDQLTAMQDTIVEFVYRMASDAERSSLAVDLLARGVRGASSPAQSSISGEQVRSAAWSAGMLARIARERELPSSIGLRLQSVFSATPLVAWHGSDASFQTGGAGALAVLARTLVPSAGAEGKAVVAPSSDAWPAWISCVDALKFAQRDRDRMVLVAIETLLTTGPEPTQSKPTFDAISLLVTSLTWRDADESRRWLLRWFDLPTVSIADLHTLTTALASKSSAAGFDVSMVLAAGAGEQDRATLRDRLRQAWGLVDGPERVKLVSGWREAAEQELSQRATAATGNPRASRVLPELYNAVVWSRLNESAGMIFAGEPGSAYVDKSLDASIRSAIDSLGQANAVPAMLEGEPTWIVRYLGAGTNVQAKKQALLEIAGSTQYPRAVGEVLVAEVVRGSNSEIRKQAAQIVREHASEAAIVQGWLEQLPTMPALPEYSELIGACSLAKLPPVRSASWRVAARRALVERLLQLLADSGERTGVDNVATLLAESYARRLSTLSFNTRPDSSQDTNDANDAASDPIMSVAPVETSARLYRQRLEHEAREKTPTGREPMSLATVSSRQDGRRKIASGRVQAFAAEQVGVFELLAYIVATERADASDQIAAILDEVQVARRNAVNISSQIEAVERGMLRLWLLRLEGGKA